MTHLLNSLVRGDCQKSTLWFEYMQLELKKGATEVAPFKYSFCLYLSHDEHLLGLRLCGRGEFVEIYSVATAISVAVSAVPLDLDIAFAE